MPLALQSPIITRIAQERCSSWSSVSVMFVLNRDRSHTMSPSEAPGWLFQLMSVPNVGFLHGWRTTLTINKVFGERDRVKSIVSFSITRTWQQLLSRRRGFNLWRAVWACATASPYFKYWPNSQTILHDNKLNNYDVMDIHCTAPSKMKLIYVQTRLKGWGSPEDKKERLTIAIFKHWFWHVQLFYMHVLGIDR